MSTYTCRHCGERGLSTQRRHNCPKLPSLSIPLGPPRSMDPIAHEYIARLTRELEEAREQVRALREALSAALDRASESQTRAERCRPGQSGGLRAIFGRWPGDETDEEIREW